MLRSARTHEQLTVRFPQKNSRDFGALRRLNRGAARAAELRVRLVAGAALEARQRRAGCFWLQTRVCKSIENPT